MLSFLALDLLKWDSLGSDSILEAGHQLNKPSILIAKIEDKFVEEQVALLEASKLANIETVFEPQKEETSFDDFTKMDIRVGEIIAAEKVKKAKKLLKLTVDTGLDKRIVVSGIAEHYTPEEVIGKKVSILMNLAPRKIRGVESQGMILMAENDKGELAFVSPEKDFQAGGEIR